MYLQNELTERKAVLGLIAVTLAYLIIELSFSAHLLDVVATARSFDDLSGVEQAGRLISGFAVALALAGFFVHRASQATPRQWLVAATVALLVIGFVDVMETRLVNTLTYDSSNSQRLSAAYLNVMRAGVIEGNLDLDGISLDLAKPDSKAFITLLPALAVGKANIQSELKPVIEQSTRSTIDSRFDDFYDTVFVPSARRVLSEYQAYEQNHPAIAPERFIASHRVQTEWRKALHYTGVQPLRVDASIDFVNSQVKPQFIAYTAERAASAIKGEGDDGVLAFKMLVAPALALLFSILGALTHTLKLVNYSMVMRRTRGALRLGVVSAIGVGFAVVVWIVPTGITSSPLFNRLEQSEGVFSPASLRWTIQAEALVYPLSSRLAKTLGMNDRGGVDDRSTDQPVEHVKL